MSEALKIVVTSGLTIVGGVVVFTCGQLIERFCIDPVHELSRLIGEVGDSLVFYANQYANPGTGTLDDMNEAYRVLRQRASQLRARAQVVRGYRVWQAIGVLPDRMDVVAASAGLIAVSNAIHQGDGVRNAETADRIREWLGIIG